MVVLACRKGKKSVGRLCLLQYILVIRCMLKTLTTTSTQWHKMKKKAGVIGSTQYLM